MICWGLGVTIFDIFRVWGPLWTHLAPWRVHGGDIGEMILSMGRLWAPFRLTFLMNIASFFMCFFYCFSGRLFYWLLMVLGVFCRGCLSAFFGYFLELRISEYLHHAQAPARFSGFGWVWFCMFCVVFGVWFLDGFGNGFLMIFRWIWGLFWLPKSIKNVIDFGIDFWTAQK